MRVTITYGYDTQTGELFQPEEEIEDGPVIYPSVSELAWLAAFSRSVAADLT